MHIDDIKIHPDLKAKLRPLTADERALLKHQIIERKKVSDKVKVAVPSNYLLDGHNRLELRAEAIAEGHEVAAPEVEEIHIDGGLDAAKAWMDREQGGRRNLTEQQVAYIRGSLLNKVKEESENQPRTESGSFAKNRKNPEKSPQRQSVATADTVKAAAQEIGTKHGGVSGRTVERNADYARAVDKIEQVNPKAGADLKSGSLKLPQAEVVALADSGDIKTGLLNLRKFGDWRGQSAIEDSVSDKPPKSEQTEEQKLVQHADKAYTTLMTHIEKLRHLVDHRESPGVFNKLNTSMADVHSGIQKLKKFVQ
jgi:hypothetical protein